MKKLNKQPQLNLMRFLKALCLVCMVGILSACIVERTGDLKPNIKVSDDEAYKTRFQLAYMYYEAGSSEVALEEVNKALKVRRTAEATSLKGAIYGQMDDMGNSLKFLSEAASLDANSPEYKHNYGAALCADKRYSEGINVLTQAAKMGKANAVNSWIAIGACYESAGEVQKAEGAYFMALEVQRNNRLALYQLASVLFKRQDYEGAREYIARMGDGSNMNAAALWLGIKVTRLQGDAYQMSQYAKQLQTRYPDSQEAAALKRKDYK